MFPGRGGKESDILVKGPYCKPVYLSNQAIIETREYAFHPRFHTGSVGYGSARTLFGATPSQSCSTVA